MGYFAEIGTTNGKAAASWVEIDSTNAQSILDAWYEGDPKVMEIQPSPLSGEWAGESIVEILGESADEADAETYEQAFMDGFWDEIQRRCLYHLS